MAQSKKKYYVVWKGRETGVFDSWEECKKQIHGFEGAKYRAFSSRESALLAFQKSPDDFIGKNVMESELSPEQLAIIGKPIEESICVDAAYDGGVMEYQGVYTKTRERLFHFGPFEGATNNVGEFLAIVHALGYLKKRKLSVPVYSDSITAIHWVKQKRTRTKLKTSSETKSLLYLVERAEKWLSENNYPNQLLKWETHAWGENPADFGRK
jgi:ribonuclease HI